MNLTDAYQKLGYNKQTPIQEGVLKVFEKDVNIVGVAPTGTGKTHAYLLPILSKITPKANKVQALIIVPTNELVEQVYEMLLEANSDFNCKRLASYYDKVRLIKSLENKQPDIIISTPDKIHEYTFKLEKLKIHTVDFVVFDEADMLLEMNFLTIIDDLMNAIRRAKKLLFTATLKDNLLVFIRKYFGSYELIDTTKAHHLKIKYMRIHLQQKTKIDALKQIVGIIQPYLALIFVSKKEDIDFIYESIEKIAPTCKLSGDMNLRARKKVLEDIHALKYQYVVSSDLLSRGIDFDASHVIHYDLPKHFEYFTHRSGRTARMEKSGVVIVLTNEEDGYKIAKLKNENINLKSYQITSEGFKEVIKKDSVLTEAESKAIKSIKRPKKVKPNYKKNNKVLITKAKKKARRKVNENR